MLPLRRAWHRWIWLHCFHLYLELICELFCFVVFGFSRMPVVCFGYTCFSNALIPVAIGYLFSCKTKLSRLRLWYKSLYECYNLVLMVLLQWFFFSHIPLVFFCFALFLMAHSKLSIRPCRNHSLYPWKSSPVLPWTSCLRRLAFFRGLRIP